MEHSKQDSMQSERGPFDAELVAIVRTLLVVGVLAILLGVLNHFV